MSGQSWAQTTRIVCNSGLHGAGLARRTATGQAAGRYRGGGNATAEWLGLPQGVNAAVRAALEDPLGGEVHEHGITGAYRPC
jgi:hypothetical protein